MVSIYMYIYIYNKLHSEKNITQLVIYMYKYVIKVYVGEGENHSTWKHWRVIVFFILPKVEIFTATQLIMITYREVSTCKLLLHTCPFLLGAYWNLSRACHVTMYDIISLTFYLLIPTLLEHISYVGYTIPYIQLINSIEYFAIW